MKYTIVVSILAALVAAETIDQLVAEIPTCAVTCIRDGAQSVNCDITDFACSCGKVEQLTAKVVPCLASSGCSSTDQATVLQLASQICAQVAAGGTSSGTASAGSVTAAATTASGTTTSSRSGTATGAAVTTTTSPAAAGRAQVAGWAGAIAAAAAFAL
ncbi:hypothetical protein CNYM01_06006 [Colletotrichum nymphaeae SA-01]|uniref:CFEM domain-containing protein n=1 Tax=Colletotrichum nymphaeae SA-01 TaxID=1460502 RepID=A0A135SSP0_9PEZI|nr:hypothetical protein CNYM01_06006 [Colletotrichum nymphaeae SA-01]